MASVAAMAVSAPRAGGGAVAASSLAQPATIRASKPAARIVLLIDILLDSGVGQVGRGERPSFDPCSIKCHSGLMPAAATSGLACRYQAVSKDRKSTRLNSITNAQLV